MLVNADSAFRALADQTRRSILQMLGARPLTSGEIAGQFESTWATISRHLAVLREAGLVSARRDRSSITYELEEVALRDLSALIVEWTEPNDPNPR